MATYYVATYGDDANAGTSPGAPFKTINKAAQVMQSGDVCYVAPGVYREAVSIPAPGSGTKTITFIGDSKATKFPAVSAGEVRLDGSDDDAQPLRTTGVVVPASVSLKWDGINIVRFVNEAFDLRCTGQAVNVHRCQVVSCGRVATFNAAQIGFTMQEVDALNIGGDAIYVANSAYEYHVIIIEDALVSAQRLLWNQSARTHISLYRVWFSGPNATAMIEGSGSSPDFYVVGDDVVVVGSSVCTANNTPNGIRFRRLTSVGNNSGTAIISQAYTNPSAADHVVVADSLLAQWQFGIGAGTNYQYYGLAIVAKTAFPDVATKYNGYYVRSIADVATITDGSGNVILPDFTPVGARILRAEEQNPIEGLRSARIDVPRVAYYKFQVAVSGPNTITLKARKSHPTGTTVKFRVDKDPSKVVTLADTDEVQTIQLGPVEDRGPRFVELEFWAQQVDYIPGHYVLIDSIQVI